MFGHDAREDIARVCRVLARHQMIDLWGHLSLRVPKSDVLMVTPRFDRDCLPRRIDADDVLVTDLSGRIVEGSRALPLSSKRMSNSPPPTRCGCGAFASPAHAMAAGIARYRLAPLTHMESAAAYDLELWEADTLAQTPAAALELAALILKSTAVHQPGIGIWASGKDALDCLTVLYHLEYLAQANLIRAQWKDGSDTVLRADSDKLWSQFPATIITPSFSLRSIPACTRIPIGFLGAHDRAGDVYAELKAAIAFGCRAFARNATRSSPSSNIQPTACRSKTAFSCRLRRTSAR